MAHIPFFRTAEGNFLDVTKSDTLNFLRTNFPAVMSETPASTLSENYQFMPSFKIAEGLQTRFGMQLVHVSQQRSTKRDPRYTEHLMRFRMPQLDVQAVGDSVPELVVRNSHNGRSKITAYAGLFRLVCSNGMVVSDLNLGMKAQRHFGANNSFQAFGAVLSDMGRSMSVLSARISRMQEVILHPHDQNSLANLLIEARNAPRWVDAATALVARRAEDEGTEDGHRNLWKTFNVLQENLTNAEVEYNGRGGDNYRGSSMRPIIGAMRDLAINESLWQKLEAFIAERFKDDGSLLIEGTAAEVTADKPEEAAPVAEPKSKTQKELRSECKAAGVKGYGNMTVSQMQEALAALETA